MTKIKTTMSETLTPTSISSLRSVLRGLLDAANLNVHQLAVNTGLTDTTIKRMLDDPHSNPTLASISKVAAFFALTPNQLIGLDPLPEQPPQYQANLNVGQQVPIISLRESMDWPAAVSSWGSESTLTDISASDTLFALRLADAALEPHFFAGMLLIFDTALTAQHEDYVLVAQGQKPLPYLRQYLVDGPDGYWRALNPHLPSATPQLVLGTDRVIATLVQAKMDFPAQMREEG